VVAIARGGVVRDTNGNRPIIDVPAIEEPTRIHKGICLLTAAYANLTGQPVSLRVANRIAWDTIPAGRGALLRYLVDGALVGRYELAKATNMPRSSVIWIGEEMQSLGIIEVIKKSTDLTEFQLSPDFLSLWKDSQATD